MQDSLFSDEDCRAPERESSENTILLAMVILGFFFTAENVNLFLKKHSMSTVDVYLVSYSELTCVKRLEM